jgi:hypothetical protein
MTLGFLLIAAGVLGPIVGFPSGGVFPGIVLFFIGRVISKQTAGTESPAGRRGSEPQPALNTMRSRMPSRAPAPPRRTPPARRMEPESPRTEKTVPKPEQKQSMLESILLAGSELADDKTKGGGATDETEVGPRMTSEEMILGKRVERETGETGVGPRMTSEEMILGKRVEREMGEMGVGPRMTSEEMIAEARKRWGHRPEVES